MLILFRVPTLVSAARMGNGRCVERFVVFRSVFSCALVRGVSVAHLLVIFLHEQTRQPADMSMTFLLPLLLRVYPNSVVIRLVGVGRGISIDGKGEFFLRVQAYAGERRREWIFDCGNIRR